MRNFILGILIGLGIVCTPVAVVRGLPPTIEQKINTGREAMLRGDYLNAIAQWEKAKNETSRLEAKDLKIEDLESKILIDVFLSLGYQEIGDLVQAQKAITSAIKLSDNQKLNSTLVAKVLNTQGNLELKQNNPQAAALNFRKAKEIYQQERDTEGEVGATVNEAIALQKLGKYRTAKKNLQELETKLNSIPKLLQASVYKILGITYATIGDFPTAIEKLEASIALTQETDIEATAKTGIDLAAVLQFSEPQTATKLLQEVASVSKNRETQAIALLNSIDIDIESQNWERAITTANQSQDLILNLPNNDFAKIDLIKKMAKLESYTSPNFRASRQNKSSRIIASKSISNKRSQPLINNRHKQLLEKIAQSARSKGTARTESYAIGTLAYIEEQQGNLNRAIELNKYALSLTDAIAADDIAYQWEWQLGRIFKTQGKIENAIVSYQKAVNNLGKIREDLVTFNPESQYSFRESVEPVYRQLVELLISQPTQDNLIQARKTVESLQMAEMENYFRQACLQAKPEKIEQFDPKAAIIYPIVTENTLAVLTSIPGQPIKLQIQPITAADLESKIMGLMAQFNPVSSDEERKTQSQEFYNWLIKPTLNDLKAAKIKTLVFVLDSALRNLPVAALYDGEKYLVEDYAIALTPGLQLLPSKAINNKRVEAVVGALSEANQGFSALPAVENEVQDIANNVNSQLLLNQKFTNNRLRKTLKETTSAPILHLATHGQFSSKPEETFILTWNDRIGVNELEELLKVREETPKLIPIELLVLSACQTAEGDTRSALGIAGIALRSGARSTVGTLWPVSDESTSILMNEFYQQIKKTSQNKAQILRQAQLRLIKSKKFNHPFYWAPFVLIGNWT
ncbi:CHAT domain-containing protein [Mastigocoleus testarum]|nr:CHAT domain-containing protein [Mastigocoleus testarum]